MEYVADQMGSAGRVTYRKMFGEYAVYLEGKVVALVCDNRLFVKPTPGGRRFAGPIAEGAPYPGAKPYLLIEDRLDDREWLGELIRLTAAELPATKKPGSKPTRKR
ncbi:MAG: TfoX/Sxy family protein [candidate division FCPU426 bacterium]